MLSSGGHIHHLLLALIAGVDVRWWVTAWVHAYKNCPTEGSGRRERRTVRVAKDKTKRQRCSSAAPAPTDRSRRHKSMRMIGDKCDVFRNIQSMIYTYVHKNKMLTSWWGRQNDAPLKFDPKP